MRTPDPSVLLCEACGYPLEGLARAGACPECATPIQRSMPGARPGTPWQAAPGFSPLLRTWWSVLTRPRAVWAGATVRPRPAASLLLVTVGVAALLPALALVLPRPNYGHSLSAYPLVFFVVAWFVMLALTSIEFSGIRFFGRQRGWRITPAVALVICAHASVGWLLGGLGMALAWLVGEHALAVKHEVLWPIIGAAFLGGMCVFSLLAGAGFHALRFVNDPVALARRSDRAPEPVEQSPARRAPPER